MKNIPTEVTKTAVRAIRNYVKLPDSPESEPALIKTLDVVTQCFLEIESQERIAFYEMIIKGLGFDLSNKKERIRFDITRSILQAALNRAGV